MQRSISPPYSYLLCAVVVLVSVTLVVLNTCCTSASCA